MDDLSRRRLAQGDPAAFAALYDRCADRVHHYLVVRLGSREDADDVLQETFVRLARNRKRLAALENLEAYVFTVARNEAARLARRNRRAGSRRAGSAGQESRRAGSAGQESRRAGFAGQEALPRAEDLFREGGGNDLQAREAAESVAKALAGLEAPLREIVELKVYAGLTFREIAHLTGLPQGTAATRYRSALAKMRTWLMREA
jgi:RNA polymerase sigma-70 factor (ECF subfamily)